MGLLEGKNILITGVLTDASLAFGVARIAQEQGAQIILTGAGRGLRLTERTARKLPEACDVLELDVTEPEQVSALRERAAGVRASRLEYEAAEGEVVVNARELDVARAEIAFLTTGLDQRTEYLTGLLDGLVQHVTPELMLDALGETEDLGVVVSGWALAESAAQTFAGEFTSRLAAHGLEFEGISIEARVPRLGVEGYSFQVTWILPEVD